MVFKAMYYFSLLVQRICAICQCVCPKKGKGLKTGTKEGDTNKIKYIESGHFERLNNF